MEQLSAMLAHAVERHQAGFPAEAEPIYRAVLQRQPALADALHLLGVALFQQGRAEEAVGWLVRAVAANPAAAVYCSNLAGVYRAVGRYRAAVDTARMAAALAPGDADMWHALGTSLKDLGEVDEALDCLSRAIELEPAHREAHIDRAFTRLLSGRELATGWREAIWRWPGAQPPQQEALPVWNGEDLSGKSLLIRGEQGLGDQLMSAGCLTELAAAAGKCQLECDPRLVPLLARSFPTVQVTGPLKQIPPADLQTWSGSLFEFLRPAVAAFPRHSGYLQASMPHRLAWRRRLEQLPAGLRVGISWFGGANEARRRLRTVPPAAWRSLSELKGIQLCSVQYAVTEEEAVAFGTAAGLELRHWPDCRPTVDQDDFAALLSELDLVITADNSTAHLAGALGLPVWNLLPFTADCRWFLHRTDSPWYPSMRLFRQQENCRWEPVLQEVARALTARLTGTQHVRRYASRVVAPHELRPFTRSGE